LRRRSCQTLGVMNLITPAFISLLCMRIIVAVSLGSCLGTGVAHGAALYTSANFVPLTREATVLTTAEARQIAQLRSVKFRRSVNVVSLNASAFEGKLVTVETPEGRTLTFFGESKRVSEKRRSYVWSDPSGEASFSWSDGALYGTFRNEGRVYEVLGFFGRYGTVSELDVLPLSEPASMSERGER
jgi:hypothetical protein